MSQDPRLDSQADADFVFVACQPQFSEMEQVEVTGDQWQGAEFQCPQSPRDSPFLARSNLGWQSHNGIALDSPNQCHQCGFPKTKRRKYYLYVACRTTTLLLLLNYHILFRHLWFSDGVLQHPELPQLTGGKATLRPDGMIIPDSSKLGQISLESRKEGVLSTEEVKMI